MTVAETLCLTREVSWGLIEFEERPPDEKTGRSYRAYHVTRDGQRTRVPSVTTILDCLDKPALNRWKCRVTATNALALVREFPAIVNDVEPDGMHDAMCTHAVDVDSESRKAAQRGVDIHTVLQRYAETGDAPNLADHPPEHRGFIRGLVGWLLADDPQPEAIEQLVAHPEHRYAGRFDLRATIRGRSCLVDLKTNREGRVYREAHLQAVGYGMAELECGGAPLDEVVLVGVGAQGTFERVRGQGRSADWLAIVEIYRRLQRLDIALREARQNGGAQ